MPQADGVLRGIEALEGRDQQLWSIGLLIMVVLAAGFLSLILPNLTWRLESLRVQGHYLPQFFFALIVLIVLFNIYVLDQRRALRSTRAELVRQLVRSEAAEKLSLIDPLTGIFNRRYLDQILPKEVSRADRLSASIAFLMVDVNDFKAINNKFGHLEGDWVLKEIARLMKETFRGSDSVVRYGGDEFLVVMVGTNAEQGQRAVARLLERVGGWNDTNAVRGYSLTLSCGLATYTKGTNLAEVLARSDKRMYEEKARHSALA